MAPSAGPLVKTKPAPSPLHHLPEKRFDCGEIRAAKTVCDSDASAKARRSTRCRPGAGAGDYVTKPFVGAGCWRVQALLRGASRRAASDCRWRARSGQVRVDCKPCAESEERSDRLTPREMKCWPCSFANAAIPFARRLLNEVWGLDYTTRDAAINYREAAAKERYVPRPRHLLPCTLSVSSGRVEPVREPIPWNLNPRSWPITWVLS